MNVCAMLTKIALRENAMPSGRVVGEEETVTGPPLPRSLGNKSIQESERQLTDTSFSRSFLHS